MHPSYRGTRNPSTLYKATLPRFRQTYTTSLPEQSGLRTSSSSCGLKSTATPHPTALPPQLLHSHPPLAHRHLIMQGRNINTLTTPQTPATPLRLPLSRAATSPREHPVTHIQRQGWWNWQRFYLTTSIPDPPSYLPFGLALPPPLMPAPFDRTPSTSPADIHTPPHYLPA